jgi:flagellar basal body rod protein FlgB
MNLSLPITDNITEILVKIIKFTKTRQQILMQNINNVHNPAFAPKDLAVLAVDEFCGLLDGAIQEHLRSRCLVLCDTENVKFGAEGTFKVKPIPDEHARKLLEKNRNEYLELQMNKLLENSLNQKVAAELLRQKQGIILNS